MLTSTFGLDPQRVLLLERGGVGEVLPALAEEMRFISPSFNSRGWTDSFDLNSVAYGVAPSRCRRSTRRGAVRLLPSELAAAGELCVQTSTEDGGAASIAGRL